MGFFTNEKELESVEFSDITIFCGSNGSGKSTLLNVISEKLGLERRTPYNKTYFFDPFLEACDYELFTDAPIKIKEFMSLSKMITSDDVFNHIIEVRERNADLAFKRELIFEDEWDPKYKYVRGVNMEDPESIKTFKEAYELKKIARRKLSCSKYVRNNIGVDERTYSNGENGFRYFSDAIKPGGLYLLDEPENSL